MNTIFALSMVAGVGLTTGTPVIGARVAEEMWAADSSRHGRGSGRKDLNLPPMKKITLSGPCHGYRTARFEGPNLKNYRKV